MVLSYENIIGSTFDVQYFHTFIDAKGCDNFSIQFVPDSDFPGAFSGVFTCNNKACTESYFHTTE